MTSADWGSALDALEERLRRQWAVLDGRSGTPAPGPLPRVSGEPPPELVPRLRAALVRSRVLEQQARDELARRRRPR